ncbi:zinc finger protein 236 isoform X2 [Nilaparvata lugens]|nr:zinc finger protein 236 isoform X2 [Nilaparvata lugens]
MANMSSSGKNDILVSNVHLVSALQSPIIWPGDASIKKATDKTGKDNERVTRANPTSIIANDATATAAPTFLTIMAPQSNSVFNASQPAPQFIMLGELAPNQILLSSPGVGVDENAEIIQCKQLNNSEPIKMEPKVATNVLVINEARANAKANANACGQVKQSKLVNALPATDVGAHVGVSEGRTTSKKRSRKVNGVTQTTSDIQTHSSTNSQSTVSISKLIPPTDLQTQAATLPPNNQTTDGSNDMGYTAQLLSQLTNTAVELPAISCSQVSSVLSALEPAGNSCASIDKQTQTIECLRTLQARATLEERVTPQERANLQARATRQARAAAEAKRAPREPNCDSEEMKHYLRAQYSVLKQEDLANNLPGIYQCSECIYLSTNSANVGTHFERFHHLKSTVATLPKRNTLKCVGCSNVFYSKHSLQVHLVQDHEVSGAEVSMMTDIIVKPQIPETGPNEPTKEEETNTYNKEQNTDRTIPKSSVSKSNYYIAKSLVIDLRRPMQSKSPVIAATATCVHSETRNSNEGSTTIDSTELTNSQYLVDLTAQFSAAAQKLPLTNTQQDENNRDVVTKDEKTVEDALKMKVNDNEDKPTNQQNIPIVEMEVNETPISRSKSDVETREKFTSPAKKRGRPSKSKSSRIKKSVTDGETEDDYAVRECGIDGCELRYEHGSNLVYHQQCHDKSKAGQLAFTCAECGASQSKWPSMAIHLWRVHNIDMELISCEQCSYKTYFTKHMTTHALTHGDLRPFLCDNCGKGFKTRKQMHNHKVLHRSNVGEESGEGEGDASKTSKFACTICGRKMKDTRNLRLHMENVHHKMRRFFCTFCSYTTYSRGSLLIHQRIHTGEKPFKCDSCVYATSDHNSLRRHKMQHSGNKPYNCPHCSYACIQASTYKTHLKSKHPGMFSSIETLRILQQIQNFSYVEAAF